MSEPIFVQNQPVFVLQDMTSTVSSIIIPNYEMNGYAMHAIWTGSPVGNIITAGGNDPTGVNFVPVDTASTNGAAGQHLLNFEVARYAFIQITYVATSGTGTLTVYVSGKRN